MNDNDLRFGTDGDNTYRATANLNTAIENPQVNINGAMDVNLGNNLNVNNVDINHGFGVEQNINNSSNDNINNEFYFDSRNDMVVNNSNLNVENNIVNENVVVSNSDNIDNSNEKVSYEPTLKQKKKPLFGIEVSREIKAMMFIIFILLVVVFVIPYVYDFFKELDLVVTS